VLPTDSHMGPSSYAFRGISDLLMSIDLYEVRPRKDKRGIDLISDALPFGRLWYEDASAAVDYAKHSSRSHNAVIRVYDEAGNVIETHEHAGDFREFGSKNNGNREIIRIRSIRGRRELSERRGNPRL
jgi:hypothetical protein